MAKFNVDRPIRADLHGLNCRLALVVAGLLFFRLASLSDMDRRGLATRFLRHGAHTRQSIASLMLHTENVRRRLITFIGAVPMELMLFRLEYWQSDFLLVEI